MKKTSLSFPIIVKKMLVKLIKFQRRFLFLFIAFSVLFSIFTVARIIYNFQLQDFSVYYRGIQDYLNHKNPYANPSGGKVIYPPISLVLLAPFGLLPYELAERVWTLVSYISIIGSIFILFKSAERKASLVPFLTVYSLFMLSFPVKFTLGMGQINLILLLLISLSFYYFRKKQQYLSGAILATAASIKLSPIVLLLFYVRKKQWKIVVSCIVIFALLNLLGIELLGMQATKDYWRDIFPNIPTVGNASYYNQALTGWLSRALIPNPVAGIINYLVFGGLLFFSLSITKTTKRTPELELGEYGLFIVTTLIGVGLAWQHHFVTTLIPFMALGLILFQKGKKRSHTLVILMLLSYLLIALNIKNPSAVSDFGYKLLLSHILYGTLLLYGLLVWSAKFI